MTRIDTACYLAWRANGKLSTYFADGSPNRRPHNKRLLHAKQLKMPAHGTAETKDLARENPPARRHLTTWITSNAALVIHASTTVL
jgi:hypothetical protein